MTTSPSTPRRWSARNVTAVLGPTNTGKTHLAIERMLGHETGMIGLPLRLLAREVYGRIAARIGEDKVALITGEEKIVPPAPRYWVSTVEAMPRETDSAFVAIDEIQLAADLERGHVFTDRLLNLRGTQETLLLGAATMRGIVEKLLPGTHIVTRPRMSVLAYAGQKKLTRLPERSAVVTFSADDVYATGELIRRQRGGAAVVLGALSPRTRNKQVELYQSGDVDFLVATDAIGMGLNLDVDHVAFAANRKFDGYQHRPLTAAELGQVAGRAGRHMRDGTFGVTARVDPFENALVEALETHRFEPVRVLQWRNDTLDFSSIDALKASLDLLPEHPGLTRAPTADDQAALDALTGDRELAGRVIEPAQVRRLWDICRLPDYRRIAPAQHTQLVRQLVDFLIDGGVIDDDWIGHEVRRASHTDGDIDTLSHRIAQVRTWTFVANQPDWVADPAAWQEETRSVEDALSDALHERLTKRFVDRRTSVLMRRLRENTVPEAEIDGSGDVLVEGEHVGTLTGFRFTPDPEAGGTDARALRNAAQQALASAIGERAALFARAPDADIVLAGDGHIRWRGDAVARLAAGDHPLKPRGVLLADEQLSGPARERVEARLAAWIVRHVGTQLKPLVDLEGDGGLAGTARGLAFRLAENMGILDRREVLQEVRGLDQEARAGLRRHGVRFGAYHIFVPALLKPGPSGLIAQLWALGQDGDDIPGLTDMQAVSASGRTSVDVDPSFAPDLYRRFGFRIFGRRAVRIDILERLADLIRPALDWRPPRDPSPEPQSASPAEPQAASAEAVAGLEPDEAAAPAPVADAVAGPALAAPPAAGEAVAQAAGMETEASAEATMAPAAEAVAGPALDPPPVEAASGAAPAEASTEQSVEATSEAAPSNATARSGDVAERAVPTESPTETPKATSGAVRPAPPPRPRPEGAIDQGGGFTVTPAMTSLLGASGDDVATILKGLGYQVERRPLPDDNDERDAADTLGVSAPAESAPAEAALATASLQVAPSAAEAPPADTAVAAPRAESGSADAAAAAPEVSPAVEAADSAPGAADAAPAATVGEPDEPRFVEIWRPVRRARGPRHSRGGAPARDGTPAREGNRGKRQRTDARPPRRAAAPGGAPGADERRAKQGNRDRPGKGRGRPPPKERPIDPDSPFAALAALKKELEKTGRE